MDSSLCGPRYHEICFVDIDHIPITLRLNDASTNLELSKAEAIIMELKTQRDEAVKKTRELEDEIIRLQTRLELAEARVDELKETQTGRDDLLMQIGQLKARLEMEKEKNKS